MRWTALRRTMIGTVPKRFVTSFEAKWICTLGKARLLNINQFFKIFHKDVNVSDDLSEFLYDNRKFVVFAKNSKKFKKIDIWTLAPSTRTFVQRLKPGPVRESVYCGPYTLRRCGFSISAHFHFFQNLKTFSESPHFPLSNHHTFPATPTSTATALSVTTMDSCRSKTRPVETPVSMSPT